MGHLRRHSRARQIEGNGRHGRDGGKSYTLHVPADAPVAQFWSFTIDDKMKVLLD